MPQEGCEKRFDEKFSAYLPEGFMHTSGLFSDEAIKDFIRSEKKLSEQETLKKVLEMIDKVRTEVIDGTPHGDIYDSLLAVADAMARGIKSKVEAKLTKELQQ